MAAMTVDALIAALTEISATGGGGSHVIIEEEGLGYTGDLIDVDTWLTGPGVGTLTLLGQSVSA